MATDRRNDRRQVSDTMLVALLRYLDRAGGPDLAEAVRSEARGDRPDQVVTAGWSSIADVVTVAAAAARLTGDPEIGRRAGEELFRLHESDPGTRSFYLSLGDPAAALSGVLHYTHKMARGRSYRIVSSDDGGCVVEGRYERPGGGHPFFCGLALGYWPLIASLFGAVGTSTHPSCQCRGDDVCRFEIRWDRGASADQAARDAARAELRRRIDTFEEMQAIAEDLARAADLASLAECILDVVDQITPAPALLVALHGRAGRPPVVAWRGLDESTARCLAAGLLDSEEQATVAGVTVKASLGTFGYVAGVSPDSSHASESSSRSLQAFARHAGARIEAVLARELAEETRQTSSALLLLAGALAETTTETEVSDCLARSIPELVGADHSAVLRWDPERHSLHTLSYVGPADRPPVAEFTVTHLPALYEIANHPAPFVLDRDTAAGYLADVMARWDEQFTVIVPLVEQGDFLGFACAGYIAGRGLELEVAFARLRGAADLAGTAFTKARLLEEIRHQALHDDLTGLPNRVLLEDQVRQGIRRARRSDTMLALLFVDLDRFKHVNDSMGHKFGDALIQAAAQRITRCLRESDIFARMGGDEFVIVLHDLGDPDDAGRVADKILDELRQPFDVAGRTLYVTASIGVSVYPHDGDHYGALLQAADSSMYSAKQAGRNTVRRMPQVPDPDGRNRLRLETELHQAIEGDQLQVLYQPQVAIADLKLVGVEALVRWDHPRLGLMAPSDFLPLAEDCGLMPQLDRAVRRMAFRQAATWHRSIGPLVVAVNLAAQSIRRPELLQEFAVDVEEFGIDPSAIEVELTEGMVGEDDLRPVVEGLTEMGLRVAIDDFGTGASVFARLQRLPLHTLKIDRSLVQGGQLARDSSILTAIIGMSHSLGLTVVAEGVENAAQAGHLRRAGCDAGQGFLFGRPAPPAEIEQVIYFQLTNLDRPPFALPPSGEPQLRSHLPRADDHYLTRSADRSTRWERDGSRA